MSANAGWAAAWRLARRDLRGGLRGLRLLFACLFLGVATLAAIGSLTAAVRGEIGAQGRTLLGGDVEISLGQRTATPRERATLDRLGRTSATIRTRAMARRGERSVLTELKGVDDAYPLYGRLTLRDGRYVPLRADAIVVGQALADRLDLRTGATIRYGTADFRIDGIVADEPDRLGEGFTLGPVAIVSLDGLARTGLIQPGSLFETKYRLRLPPGVDAGAVRTRLERAFAGAGWTLKDRDAASPGTDRFLRRMGQFLSLIGLAALAIAGIGVGNGVASYLAGKRAGIATLKVLGATTADIARIYLLQVGIVTLAAVVCGLAAGAALTPVLARLAGEALPVRGGAGLHPLALLQAAGYGTLVALVFALPPLARARTQPAAALFRARVEGASPLGRGTWLASGGAAVAAVALAVALADEPRFAAAVLGGVAATLVLLLGLGIALVALARRLPRPRRPLLRLALANLHRPGAQTVALVVALGLSLTLFVTLAAVQTSLSAEIARVVPARAPDLFVLDVPKPEEARFRALVARTAPGARINVVPALRGRITAFGSQRVADLARLPEGAWILRGERGITYAATPPEGSTIVAGRWWPPGYAGPPLVSLDAEQARALGVGVGDTLTVSVLGREIAARIASLRRIDWGTMGFNYVLIFPPSLLASAPHRLTATLTLPAEREGAVTRALLDAFSGASVIAVGDVVAQVGTLLAQVSRAIVAAASVTVLAGVAVLVGAIAAGRAARQYDGVILKVLGATRAQVLGAQLLEYALLALALAGVALALGMLAAWVVIVQVFGFTWAPDWGVVAATLVGGAAATLGIALAGSLPILSVRPARALREL